MPPSALPADATDQVLDSSGDVHCRPDKKAGKEEHDEKSESDCCAGITGP